MTKYDLTAIEGFDGSPAPRVVNYKLTSLVLSGLLGTGAGRERTGMDGLRSGRRASTALTALFAERLGVAETDLLYPGHVWDITVGVGEIANGASVKVSYSTREDRPGRRQMMPAVDVCISASTGRADLHPHDISYMRGSGNITEVPGALDALRQDMTQVFQDHELGPLTYQSGGVIH